MTSYEKRTWWTKHGLTRRLADASFLEAAIASAYVIAAADGTVSEDEHDALLDRLQILGDVDRDRIDALLTGVAELHAASNAEALFVRVREQVRAPGDAEAVLMLALAIALADDDVSAVERAAATRLATAMNAPAADLDAMIAELRG
jgi:tellurite resistance protein